MPGETDLPTLLRTLQPTLRPGEFVFCAVDEATARAHLGTAAVVVREAEGVTLVLLRADAERAGLPHAGAFRCVTLAVHSSLEAVGLLAAVTGALAARGIAANAVAGFHHDHLFVPAARAEEALAVLGSLSAGGGGGGSRG